VTSLLVSLAAGSALAQSATPVSSAAPAGGPAAASPADRFRRAGDLVRGGDAVKAIGIYRDLASAGLESASLYWNWAQAASMRGEVGEALWAILRARELDPGDRALSREVERLREAANLDPAEIAPQPLAGLRRVSRWLHLGLLALALATVSVASRLCTRLLPASRWPARAASLTLVAALASGAPVIAASFARPAGVVIGRGAPLVDAASPTASPLGSLRQGEVVPLLEWSGEYVRVEDSSGARGWAHRADVWPVDQPPDAPRETASSTTAP
jgi:hypothetical protein